MRTATAFSLALLSAFLLPPGAMAQGWPGSPAPTAQPSIPDAGWQTKRTARLQALDKVTARVTVLEAPLNQPTRYGTLLITVRACNARPPEEVPDAAAWLQVTDTRNASAAGAAPAAPRGGGPLGPPQGAPGGDAVFAGWMFANAPGIAMLEHPVYDLRVLECH
ncbi:DUF2155 domain-containing protein [Pseudoroseomonas globiformis]|uniref:DUF2155 domain-containing protein n=1 Tax=Teichococcus globiformis TaxID=2307229 RepID=A0ABV7G682_9PROT